MGIHMRISAIKSWQKVGKKLQKRLANVGKNVGTTLAQRRLNVGSTSAQRRLNIGPTLAQRPPDKMTFGRRCSFLQWLAQCRIVIWVAGWQAGLMD